MNWKKFLAAVCVTAMISSIAIAAENDNLPSEVNADEIDYDMETGIVTATGNVLLKHGTGRATGAKAMYNINTQEAYLVDNVIVVREDVRLTCNNLRSFGEDRMHADGNVHITQTIPPSADYPNGDTRTFDGEHVDYYPNDRGHVVIPTGGIANSGDGTFIANQIEGWGDEEYYIGTGNVHIISPPREMEAGGDRVDYYAKDNGKAILTGNAWAVQKNNTMRGNRLTVYLSDNKDVKIKNADPEPPTTDRPFTE